MERPEERMEPHAVHHARYHRGMRGAGWLSAFALGAFVGGVAGLLFAPRKGSELRATLGEAMPRRGVSAEFRQKVQEMVSSGRTTPGELTSRAQRELDELRSQAIDRLSDARLRSRILRKQAELRYLQGMEKLRQEV
ncbi:MAG: YtxH domain-containing protein [Anaerolineae bacterium]|nr:YtxH domain-containing protein [Anaerolineae bacterium]